MLRIVILRFRSGRFEIGTSLNQFAQDFQQEDGGGVPVGYELQWRLNMVEIVDGFMGLERERVRTHLRKLLPYLNKDGFVIVGGLSTRYHLISHGIQVDNRPFNDLDIIVRRLNTIRNGVAKDFLISHFHFHPNHPEHNDDFYVVLIDPESKTKIDIFDAKVYGWPLKLVEAPFDGGVVNIQSIEDSIAILVIETYRITKGNKNNEKQLKDAKLLMPLADKTLLVRCWNKIRTDQHPRTIDDALREIEEYAKKHPDFLVKDMYKRKKPYQCEYCSYNPNFPLTSMEEVFKVLGYIE